MARVVLVLAALGLACSPADGEGPSLPPPDGGPRFVTLQITPPERLDLLFMLDNSPSPTGQMELGQNVDRLLRELMALPGGTPDLHIGVITSDMGAGRIPLSNGGCPVIGGDRGVLQSKPFICPVPTGQRFLSVARGASVPIDTLRCMMKVGVTGCGYEHQLAAVAAALDPVATPENAGFLRPDAALAIVLITDEDDCSAPPETDLFAMELSDQGASTRCALAGHVCRGSHPPAAEFTAPLNECRAAEDGPLYPVKVLVERIRASKADPDRQLAVAAIFAMPGKHPNVPYQIVRSNQGLFLAPACQSQLGEATVGLRMSAFVDALGPAAYALDVCVDDLGTTATTAGAIIVDRFTSACLPESVVACDVNANGPLPRCQRGDLGPCWQEQRDARCPDSGGTLRVFGTVLLAPGTTITARCQAGVLQGQDQK
ncbi:MAG TPA: hypothetical protein VN914_15775 [Polyangia bacterium]|nr:hypothetical protein [Polyangia bacterium]